jgi:hypothetical protein
MSRQLWVAVLASGLLDAARGEEVDWIGSRDFREICDLLDLAPEVVERRFIQQRQALAAVAKKRPKRPPRPRKIAAIVSVGERRRQRAAMKAAQRAQERAS